MLSVSNTPNSGYVIIERQSFFIKDYEDFSYDLTDPEIFNNPPKL